MTAADELAQNGIPVTVYDMGRSPGLAKLSWRILKKLYSVLSLIVTSELLQ